MWQRGLVSIDVIIARRLAYIRYLHQLGTQQALLPAPLSSASILMLHDAAESFLLLVAEHVGVTPPTQFEKYWDVLNGRLPSGASLTVQQGMRRLNKVRVALKHHGAHPDETTIELALADTATFMAANTQLVFGIDYETVSLAYVITQDPVRELAEEAEVANSHGDRISAMIALLKAFNLLLDPHEAQRSWSERPSSLAFGRHVSFPLDARKIARLLNAGDYNVNGHDCQKLGEQIEALGEAVDQMRPVIRLAALGISVPDYQRFQNLTPVPVGFINGRTEYRAPKGYQPSVEEYTFGMQFVVAASLRLAELDARLVEPAWMPAADNWGRRRPFETVAEERR